MHLQVQQKQTQLNGATDLGSPKPVAGVERGDMMRDEQSM